jgi:hypothetical protein
MPTIIDSLVVELGLDNTKFDKGQKDAVNSLRQLENSAQKHVKGVTTETEKLVQSFTAVQGRLLAIGALLAAGLGFESFTAKVARLNAETGFLAQSLGVSTQELQKWEGAGATVGAQANEIAAGFARIKDSMSDLQLGSGAFLSEFSRTTHMRGQGPAVELFDSNHQKRSPTDILVDISKWYAAQPDKAVATRLMSKIGLGQGMTNLIGLGPDELQKRLKRAEQFAPNDDQIKKFQELGKAFGELTQVADALERLIASKLAPVLTGVLKMLTEWLDGVAGKGQNPAEAAGSGLGKMGYSELDPTGKKPSLMSRGWNYLFGGKGGASAPEGSGTPSAPGAVGGGAQSNFLQQQRQGFANELKDPAVRRAVAGMAMLEGSKDPVPVVEALANRYGYVNEERAKRGMPPMSVREMLGGGFYGPINRGQLPGAVAQLERNAKLSGRMNSAIDTVIGGSNTLRGFTDQGLPSDPNGGRLPHVARGGNVFPDWNGGPGGFRAAAAYRERLMAGVAAEASISQDNKKSAINVHPILPSASSSAGRSFENWRNLGLGSRGALMRGGDSTTNNSNSSSTHIGSMNVSVPPGADPAGYAAGIRQELQHFDNVQNSNTGLQ